MFLARQIPQPNGNASAGYMNSAIHFRSLCGIHGCVKAIPMNTCLVLMFIREKRYDEYLNNSLYHVTDTEAEVQLKLPEGLLGSALNSTPPVMTSSQKSR